MKNKTSEKKYYLAKVDFGEGNSSFLNVTMDKDNVYFVRDKNGVNAWHCGSLPKTDHRILEIKPYDNE